jgi:hypothetical protein
MLRRRHTYILVRKASASGRGTPAFALQPCSDGPQEVRMRRLVAVALVVLGCAPGAEALTVRDLIELSRAGLGEEVLLALIEVNRGVYAIDSATLVSLKQAGVSDRVIAALVRSGREQPLVEPPPAEWEPPAAAQPPVVVIEHHTAIQHVPIPVPVYVAVPTVRPRHRAVTHIPTESTFVPFQTGPPSHRPTPPPPSSRPVYWGFGGELRPDAWKPAAHRPDVKPDSHKAAPRKPSQKD